ncbi:MAG: helix-turn-helix domain-containing protein [Thermomicrobiales bacterium]
MSIATATKQTPKRAWDTSLYSRIVEERVLGDEVRVLFANHTWATAPLDELLPGERERANWDRMTYSPHEIIVPTEDGAVEISGFSIRALTDPEFAAHLDNVEKQSAIRIGKLVQQWREERRLSITDLAQTGGVDAAIVSRVEQGAATVSFSTLRQILAPLGRTTKDLAVPAKYDEEQADEDQA